MKFGRLRSAQGDGEVAIRHAVVGDRRCREVGDADAELARLDASLAAPCVQGLRDELPLRSAYLSARAEIDEGLLVRRLGAK